jgi:aminoglycoside phosphotransferase
MLGVPGTNLAVLAERLSPDKIVEMLATALRAFHSADPADCPFKASIPGKSLVHGDACITDLIGRESCARARAGPRR